MLEADGQELVHGVKHLGSILKIFGVLAVLLVVLLVALDWMKSDGGAALAEGNAMEQDNSHLFESVTSDLLEPAAANGWQTIDGDRIFFDNGVPASGERVLNGVRFTLDERGAWVSTRLDVPYISQLPDMPAGCEVVSVTMMLNYADVAVTKEAVAAVLPYNEDPNLGFNGDLYSDIYAGVIWPSALVDLVKSFKGTAVDLTGASWENITRYLESGKPVCIWFRSEGLDHTVLLTGYSATSVWINDPLAEKDVELDLETFMLWWESNECHALSY